MEVIGAIILFFFILKIISSVINTDSNKSTEIINASKLSKNTGKKPTEKIESDTKQTPQKVIKLESENISHLNKNIVSANIPYKSDYKSYQIIINKHKINCLYHFTDRQNLQSIRSNSGLYSWYTCNQRGIKIPAQGGSELSKNLDQRHGLQDYVRLCFNKNHPMFYVARRDGRLKSPYFLEILTDVIYWQDTLFSNENAASNTVIIGGSINHFNNINFIKAKTGIWQNEIEKKQIQAEVLVKTHIPIQFIRNI